MATVPRNARSLTRNVLDLARKAVRRRLELSEAQEGVAHWLRGNNAAIESIRKLLTARTEGRALSPIPSDPTSALIDKARDYEVRSILAELTMLYESPMPSLHQAGDETE